MSLLLNPRAVVFVLISLVLLSVPVIPHQENVLEYTHEPFMFELPSSPTVVTRNFLFIHWKEAHQSIRSTDWQKGTFNANFVFDNGVEKKTSTENVRLLPGEQKEVITEVPFSGSFNLTVNVLPPFRTVTQTKTVETTINAWSMIGSWLNPLD